MKKILLILALLFSLHLQAQDFSFYGNAGFNTGFEYQTINFNGQNSMYSVGSGFALQVGLQYVTPLQDIFIYSQVGIAWTLAYQFESLNGFSNKSAYTFNHKSISLGIGKLFPFKNPNFFNGITLNGGADFNIPSTASMTENNQEYGEIAYRNAVGFHLEAILSMKLTDAIFLEPGIGFNSAYFNYTSYNWSPGRPEVEKLNPNASNFSLFLGLRTVINGKKE
jgi:hypothetical protein